MGLLDALILLRVVVRHATQPLFSAMAAGPTEQSPLLRRAARRITRRMVLTKHDTLERYAQFVGGNSKELDALYSDVLISVTSFFRNPDPFEVLQREVWPALLQQRGDEPLRVWTLGCSTGQEAYSIAMSLSRPPTRHRGCARCKYSPQISMTHCLTRPGTVSTRRASHKISRQSD